MKNKRLAFTILSHIAFAIMYMQRLNLSIAITAMVPPTQQQQHNITQPVRNGGKVSDLDIIRDDRNIFSWNEAQQGLLLSAVYYGYAPMSFPAGVVVNKYGGKIVCGASILASSLFSLLTPVACVSSLTLGIVVRVCMGLSHGFILPSLFVLIGKWATKDGQNRMIALTSAGEETGAIVAFFLGGILSESNVLGKPVSYNKR